MKLANTYHIQNRNYRNSFQGQEHHDEIRGKGNYINYKYRGHDPRIGRLDWLVDPLAKDYPWNSPYAFSENRVLDGVELEGLEWSHTWDRSNQVYGHSYTVKIKVKNSSEVVSDANLQAFLKSIKPNVEQNFTKNFQGSSMKVNIIFDFDSPIDPANDFYIDAIDINSDGLSVLGNAILGESQSNRISLFVGVDGRDETLTDDKFYTEIQTRTFSHELGHTVGLDHPYDDLATDYVRRMYELGLIDDNLMIQSAYGKGTNLIENQSETIYETVKSQECISCESYGVEVVFD